MICLTGDIHHMSMKGIDHQFLKGTEVDAAKKYIQIASKYKIKLTLFITGKCVKEESEKIKALLSMGEIELGGHNYWAFTPSLPYKLSGWVFKQKLSLIHISEPTRPY